MVKHSVESFAAKFEGEDEKSNLLYACEYHLSTVALWFLLAGLGASLVCETRMKRVDTTMR